MRQWYEIEAKTQADWVSQIFQVKNSDKLSEYEYSMVGLGLHREIVPGEVPPTTQRGKAYKSVFTARDYALQVEIHKNVIDDDQYGWAKLQNASQGLARSARRTKNRHAVAALEGGFTTVWNSSEGAYFFSDSHPLAPGAATPPSPHSAGYFSNLVSAGLSISALKEGLEKLKTCPDAQGEPMDLTEEGVTLIVPTVLGYLAHQIIDSPGIYNQPNLSINYLKGQITIVECPLLQSPNQWYLRAALPLTKGYWFEREKPNTTQEYDPKTRLYTQISYMRYSFGWSDPRGWIGGKPSS
jgi:hypothetical protein